MGAELNDEQREKLKQVEERHQHWLHHHSHDSSEEPPSATP
jgi:hypothetical protein